MAKLIDHEIKNIILTTGIDTTWEDLSEQVQQRLISKYLSSVDGGYALDMVMDSICDNADLLSPIRLAMAGSENPNFNILQMICSDVHRNLSPIVRDYWVDFVAGVDWVAEIEAIKADTKVA